MKLGQLIRQLQNLSSKHGGDTEVIMADDEPVVRAVFCDKYPTPSVVITDRK